MKNKAFAVVFEKYNGSQGRWEEPKVLTSRRSRVGAVLVARVLGNHHRDLRVTRALYHRTRSSIEVQDRRTGKRIWEHPGKIVPSVGEVGYW